MAASQLAWLRRATVQLVSLMPLAAATGIAAQSLTVQERVSAQQVGEPRLVVLITIDQLRGDYIDRFAANLDGGLLRFREHGTFFANGEQDHANTSTAPGHSTLLSGRVPASTNIISNDLGVPDPGSPLIGGAQGPGASPFRFRGSTLLDWMLVADPETRALSVGRKDRAAILTVGAARTHVYWWAVDNRFTTSSWYARTLPDWVVEWNAGVDADSWVGREWTLLLPEHRYPEVDDQPFEGVGARRGSVFPHRLTTVDSLWAFPWMDSLTLDLARTGVRELELGMRDGVDLLSVGLSTLDVIGHHFGPDSREVHDQVLRVDRWLGEFMRDLEAYVPAERILYVLTSDHGVTSMPEYLHAHGTADAGRVALLPAMRSVATPIQQRHRHLFGFQVQSGVVLADTAAMRARGIDVEAVRRDMVAALDAVPGVARVWTPASLEEAPEDHAAARLWRRAIPPSYAWLAAAEVRDNWITTTSIQATHGWLQAENRSVPIAFLGAGVPALYSPRAVATVDIAPTLAALLRVQPTEPLDGTVIAEIAGAASAADAAENAKQQ